MTWLRSLLFNLGFWVWTVAVQLTSVVVLVPGMPRSWLVRVGRIWIRGVMGLLRVVVGIDSEIRGRENVPDGPCLIAAKHQSAWDTLIFSLLFDDPSFVLKRELLWLPVFGWYLRRFGVVPVDRRGGAGALRRMVAESRAIVAQGRPIVIFPEGTRVPPGEARSYHPGVAALYRELGLPVVPVALNSGAFWGRRAFLKRPGTIRLEFLPPIPPGLDRKAFMRRLGTTLETASRRLILEGADAESPRDAARADDA